MKKIFTFIFIFWTSCRFTLSAPPTEIKDTLSSSQLSFFGRLDSGVNSGDSLIRIALSGNPSNNTNNLFVGDTIGIGTTALNGPLTTYTINDIGNTALFQINSAIGQSNAFVGAAVIATRSAIHTISFIPQSNFTSGFWEFLIKASDRSGETINDGIPDTNGFDLGQDIGSTTTGAGTRLKVTDVTCPNWGTGTTTAYSVGTTAIVTSNAGVSTTYHVVSCYLGIGGTNVIGGVGYTLSIGQGLSSGSQLINPSPKDTTQGSADVYTFFIRHRDSSNVLADSDTIQGKIALVEAIRVSAIVDPTITFTIDAVGVGTGSTACNSPIFGTNAASTTATQVAFGSLSLASANDLGQRLSCTTNSNNGYVVTVYEDGNMKNTASGTTIPDTTCGGNGCSISGIGTSWTSFSASGWGYTIQNFDVGITIFSNPNYRPFGNGAQNAQQIMKNTGTPTTTEQAYVCYRLTASTTQEAGNYENRLIYTATATF